MDSMSYRNNRPAQQREQAESTPAPKQHVQTQPVRLKEQKGGRSSKRWLKVGAAAAALLLVIGLSWFMFSRSSAAAGVIDGNKYQAVFFTNGQVYFGKLSSVNDDYMRLKGVYYLQNKKQAEDTSPQSTSSQNASDVELIKLGNEIHGPDDEMIINKDQILFFENLKPAGTVSKTISDFQKK